MSVTQAKSAGFCFGVSRAVDLVEQAAKAGKKVVTLGPIIHNRHVVDRFRGLGVGVIEVPEQAQPGDTVIIRSHGVTRDVVNRLEDYVASMRFKADPVILLESNDRLCGLEHITVLHQAIVEKRPLEITYKPFNSPEPLVFCFSPYILKEFRNRWFVFGRRHDKIDVAVVNLALDRIEGIVDAPKSVKYQKDNSFQPSLYFKDIVGVTRYEDSLVEQVVFSATPHEVPYIRTKPIHHSQKEIESLPDGSILFSIDVIPNRELERDLLAFGDGITVLSPQNLVERLQARLQIAVDNYKKSDKI
jgi:hypothetical protein